MSFILALLFAALWSWSLTTANTLGGFVHVPLVAAFACAILGLSRHRRAVRG